MLRASPSAPGEARRPPTLSKTAGLRPFTPPAPPAFPDPGQKRVLRKTSPWVGLPVALLLSPPPPGKGEGERSEGLRCAAFGIESETVRHLPLARSHITKTKRHENWYQVLILGARQTIFRAWPGSRGLGAKCDRKTRQNRPKLEARFEFISLGPSQCKNVAAIVDSGPEIVNAGVESLSYRKTH